MLSDDYRAEDLVRAWVHAHEEDRPGVQVFVPADRELPPSRGRVGFALAADGSATAGLPGPADAGMSAGVGTWRLEGDVLELQLPGWVVAYEVLSLRPDRLELSTVPRR